MQRDVEVRVLILDDASPEPENAEQLVSEDCRVQYRRHQHNRGHMDTYNEGIEWADGDLGGVFRPLLDMARGRGVVAPEQAI